MGRLHLSSAPKYIVKQEPVCEEQCFAKWADQAFDPESENLSGHSMVYEAFIDKDSQPLPDDGDLELSSESSSSAATEDLDEYPTLRRVSRERLRSPPSPTLSTHSVELVTNVFDDFVRVEVPQSDSLAITPATRPSSIRPSSPLRQSVTSTTLDELLDHPPSDAPEVALQRGDDERLFAYYQSYMAAAPPERERPHYMARVVPRMESRPWPSARRIPGHSRFLPTATRIGEAQRTPLANPPSPNSHQPRPRSASYSEVIAHGARVPERWLAAVDGTVVSSRVLAQR